MSVDIPPSGTRGGKGPPHGAVGRMLTGVARRVHRLTGSKIVRPSAAVFDDGRGEERRAPHRGCDALPRCR